MDQAGIEHPVRPNRSPISVLRAPNSKSEFVDFGFCILDFGFWILDLFSLRSPDGCFAFWILYLAIFKQHFALCIRYDMHAPTGFGGDVYSLSHAYQHTYGTVVFEKSEWDMGGDRVTWQVVSVNSSYFTQLFGLPLSHLYEAMDPLTTETGGDVHREPTDSTKQRELGRWKMMEDADFFLASFHRCVCVWNFSIEVKLVPVLPLKRIFMTLYMEHLRWEDEICFLVWFLKPTCLNNFGTAGDGTFALGRWNLFSCVIFETNLFEQLWYSRGTGADLPIQSNEAMANQWMGGLINHRYLLYGHDEGDVQTLVMRVFPSLGFCFKLLVPPQVRWNIHYHELGTERATSLIQVCNLWWMSDKVPQGRGVDPVQLLSRRKYDSSSQRLNLQTLIW